MFFVKSKEQSFCPYCSEQFTVRDSKNRSVIRNSCKKETYRIRRLKYKHCHSIHNELPDFMQPNKHYEAAAIASVINERSDDCPAENSTLNRWRKWFRNIKDQMSSGLNSLLERFIQHKTSLLSSVSLLDKFIMGDFKWLTSATRLLINTGLWQHTQFACTPHNNYSTLSTNKWKEFITHEESNIRSSCPFLKMAFQRVTS